MEKKNKPLSDWTVEELEERLCVLGTEREELRKLLISKRNDMSKYIKKWFIIENDKENFEFFKPLTYMEPIPKDDDRFLFKGIFISSCGENKLAMDSNYSMFLYRDDIPDMFSEEAKIDGVLNYVGQTISSCQEEIKKLTKIN